MEMRPCATGWVFSIGWWIAKGSKQDGVHRDAGHSAVAPILADHIICKVQ